MSSKIWFIVFDGQVTGPYDPSEIEAKIPNLPGCQIWGRGQGEWMEPTKWRQALKETPIQKTADLDSSRLWKIRIEGQEKAPMKYLDLIQYLKGLKDFSHVDVYIENQDLWKEIYALQHIVDDLGISRRSHPRVPILGTLECEGPQGDFTCRAISISEGGLGVSDARNLHIGDRFRATLTSPNLYMAIDCICEVVYVGNDGYAGLRFSGLPMDAKSSVIEYVNKFATP